MALPTLVKTWQYSANQRVVTGGDATNDYRRLLLAVKNILSGSGSNFSNPWKVAASSNSVTAGKDYVDRWSTSGNLVWSTTPNGGAHSWIVLTQPQLGASCSLCIDCAAPGGAAAIEKQLGLFFSLSGGFTVGGSTTVRPSASDEIVLRDGTNNPTGHWFGGINTLISAAAIHGLMSSDGQVTRLIGLSGSTPLIYWTVEALLNPSTGSLVTWSPPAVAIGNGQNSVTSVTAFSLLSSAYNVKAFLGKSAQASITSETAAIVGPLGNYQPVAQQMSGTNEISNNFPLCPLGVASTTVGVRGRLGTMFDIWFGTPNVATGDTYGTQTFAQFGNIVVPWNGTTPTIA
jgi:hypothetical protein